SRGKALGARGHVSHGRRSPVVERQPVAHGNGKSSAAKLKAVPPGQVEKARKLPKRHTRKVPDRARLKKAK
ncbi:MAG TPA: hypothetical protein VF101_20080, partial [Gaiellaceae bacterium]